MVNDSSVFSDKLRLRICGLLVEREAILLAKIHSPVTDKLIWTPPGGGLEFGETMKDCLKREFKEETNLQINVRRLIHINELIDEPFHSVECYFEVNKEKGELQLGSDPELDKDQQMLEELAWIPIQKLSEMPFAPQDLIIKLKQWQQRSNFYPYVDK